MSKIPADGLVRLSPGNVKTIEEITDSVLAEVQRLFEIGEHFTLTLKRDKALSLGESEEDGAIFVNPKSSAAHIKLTRIMEDIARNPDLAVRIYRGLNPVQSYADRFAQAPSTFGNLDIQ